MIIPKEIKSNIWLKNWSFKWRAPFASLYQLYTTNLKNYTGKNLPMTMVICEYNTSSNYITKNDLDAYCLYCADQVAKEPKLAKKWIDDTLSTASEMFETMRVIKTKNNPGLTDLLKLKSIFYRHIPPHFTMKKVIDYLPLEIQKKVLPEFREVRIKTDDLFNQVDEALGIFTKLISQKSGYQSKLIDFLTVPEIIIFFEKQYLPSLSQLKKRFQGMAIFYKGTKSLILLGKEYQRLQKILDRYFKELKGTVAYPGKVSGKARIVFDPFKAGEFSPGDILVTGMTRPEFLPLMRKSAAVVTDAGGMLSHAAIVARELKKPCILGTEAATRILKNEDLVEVDANKGIIKVLDRRT